VTATTRNESKIDLLRSLGADPVVVDGLDAVAVGAAVASAEPDAIIHQMTALTGSMNLKHFDRWFAVTNELRTRGTQNLLAAARATGVERFIAQSYTNWTNPRDGAGLTAEADPLDPHPPKERKQTLAAISYLEEAMTTAPLEGIVLRYGNLYGPGASEPLVEMVKNRKLPIVGNGGGVWSWTHVDDAAAAAVVALEHGKRGIYNIVDDEPAPVAEWLPYLAQVLGAKPPRRAPIWLIRPLIGEVGVSMMTDIRGSSNAKAKRELGWQPIWHSWRDGFRDGLTDAPATAANRQPARAA
jgi:nucleoside-diphosphate-sugar epimerase